MGFINSPKSTREVYEVDLKTLTKIIANDLGIGEAGISIDTLTSGYNTEFIGIKVIIDSSSSLKLGTKLVVRGDTQFGIIDGMGNRC